jgi:type IV secretion system protein VirB9
MIEQDFFENESQSEIINYSSNKKQNDEGFFDKIVNIFSKEKKNIEVFDYEEEKTYPVNLHESISTIISLPEAEKIIFFSLGNNDAFKVNFDESVQNIISITTLQNNVNTNLIIKTDLGFIYNFYLSSFLLDESGDSQYHYTIYIKSNKKHQSITQEKILLRDLQENNDYIKEISSLDKLNTSYKIMGDKEIAPVFVYDDGKWTYFDFGKNFVSNRLPNVYKLVDKYDSVTNVRINGNLVVAQSLSEEGWSLKNGEKVVCIRPKQSLFKVYKDDRFKQ